MQELLNSSTTMILLNLTVGGSFTARVQAYTRSGYGPYSAPVPIIMDPAYPARAYSSTTNGEAWIIVLLAALVVMLACVIVTVVYLKRKQNAGKQLGHFNGKHSAVTELLKMDNDPCAILYTTLNNIPCFRCSASSQW